MAPIGGRSHEQRDRAESFGAIAADYDRYRPGYPQQLIDDLVALRPASVLDVGCGTGKATALLAGAGLRVLGVELDEQMAAVARARGLDVEVGAFETWDDQGRTFDLITCAQAWHWVDPARGVPKAARLLGPGGTVVLMWNFDSLDDVSRAAIEPVYARFAPQLLESIATGTSRRDQHPFIDDLHTAFADVTTRTYPWRRVDTVEDFVRRIGTHSDHLVLGAETLAELQAGLRAALESARDEIVRTGGTYVILARN